MRKPVMNVISDPVVTEETAEAEPLRHNLLENNSTGKTAIFTDIDLPTEPIIPEGADVLDTERVFHSGNRDFS